jgi:hypothetical protein
MVGLFDTQKNLLTVLLVACIGTLIVAGIAQGVFLGKVDVDRIPAVGQTGVDDSQVDVPDTGLAEIGEYTAITQRPVFFSDRRLPVVELVELDDDEPPIEIPQEEEVVNELRAVVAGIIITPDLRLAMVRDEAANKTRVMREGMSLEGDQAAWRLDSIAPRIVNFVSVDGRESGLELKVNTSGLTAGSPGTIRTPASRRVEEPQPVDDLDEHRRPREETPTDTENDARARAEEVRRRVAERRAELRAEAERRAQMQQQRQDN